MKKINASAEDVVGAILGAAIMGGLAAQADAEQAETENKPTEELTRALELRKQYEAFIEVGFTEDQATQFIAAILH